MSNAQGQWAMTEHMVTEAGIGVAEFLIASLTVALGAWSLALRGVRADIKEVRSDWLAAMKDLTSEIAKMREEMANIANRLTRVEVEQAHQKRHDH